MTSTTTTKYLVSANCAEFGIYEAESEQGARDLCAQDAGYRDEADMVEQLDQPSELVAEPVTSAARINTIGMEQIAVALGEHHKLGRDHFTPAMLQAWAVNAEQSYDSGSGCCFEIKSWDSVTGAPVVVTIGSEGFDLVKAE